MCVHDPVGLAQTLQPEADALFIIAFGVHILSERPLDAIPPKRPDGADKRVQVPA